MRVGRTLTLAALLSAFLAGACAGDSSSASARGCARGLDAAYDELRAAEASGLLTSLDMIKAAGLLTAAKVQYEFEHYPNCLNKVRRARAYIRNAKGG